MKEFTNNDKEYYEGANEHMSCFGNYVDKDNNFCEDGTSGSCSYCEECRRVCIYI